jgi:GWxTD domain-containing protein
MRSSLRCWCVGVMLLAVGGTATAQSELPVDTARLRADASAHPDSFSLVLAWGQALARAANERSGDWRPRSEARKILERANRLRPSDPRPYLELGLLLRKQGFRVDGLRLLERAEDRAAKSDDLSTVDRAELHYQMALIYEVWWEDDENLGLLPEGFVTLSCPYVVRDVLLAGGGWRPPPSSPRANLLAYNIACPDVFDEVMQYWFVPDGQGEGDRDRMLHHFRAAIAADPSDPRPALRLLRHLAAADAWEEYLEVAVPLARRRPADPDVLLFLGLGLHATGQAERADSAFALAIEHADDALRRDLLQPQQLLREQDSTSFSALPESRQEALTDVFWRARDPLFLTMENERFAEHLARLAYVEVAYSSPQSGLRGRWSDRGAAWLRWGRPLRIRALRGGEAGIMEFWDYGEGSPDLVFQRLRTYRWARYEENTAEYVRYARERVPELYASDHPRMVATIPFQAAAFRDSGGGGVLEVYAAVPGGVLWEHTDVARLEAGVFVLTGDGWEPRAARRQMISNEGASVPLAEAFPLPAGSYVVSVEAAAGDIAATGRERIDIPAFSDSLMLSDLLLVEEFGVDTSQVDSRAALAPVVSPTRVFPVGAPVGIVWEIYGLQPDASGVARYTVRAEVADANQSGAFLRMLKGLFGTPWRPQGVEWGANRVPRADGAVVEFVTFDMPTARPGSYRLFVTVTDQMTGRSFTVHRAFAIAEP